MRETIEAYDRDAAAYAARTVAVPDSVRADLEHLATRLGSGARVLEIGSGGGRDALLMEELGLAVRRTDITPGFVDLLRGQGHDCDLLDPLVDDLASADGPYDAVWANASLLHVDRRDLSTVLSRLAHVTRPGGLLRASFKDGDGAGWSVHGTISGRRHFTYWRAPDLEVAAAGSGWSDIVVRRGLEGERGETWLGLSAIRDGVSS
ncbi:MAG TPA: class I SAM-dependent methyltransferase [Nocardioides sp.]|nr:class I SAM-dependent methyltransferase [Nocardioides sp.]